MKDMTGNSDASRFVVTPTSLDNRRIGLLKWTTELLSFAIYEKLHNSDRYSDERKFWGDVQGFILRLDPIRWKYSMFVDQTQLVNMLLSSLESMIRLEIGSIAEVNKSVIASVF